MITPVRAALALLLPVSVLPGQVQGRNLHLFHNVPKTQFATRPTSASVDQLLCTQPLSFHYNGQRGMGWEVLVQDQEVATSEAIVLSWHAVQADLTTPVVTPLATDTYRLFGVGSGPNAFVFTLVTANPVALPGQLALGVRLPMPHPWPGDAALVHYQRGDSVKLPASHLKQWSWLQSGASAVPVYLPGSTFHLGGIYDRPVVRGFTNSSAYGAGFENLAGPESLHPWPSRGDRYALQLAGDRFKSLATQRPSLGAISLAAAYLPAPIPTPFGSILLPEAASVHVHTGLLDLQGVLSVPPFPIPNVKVTACLSAVLINLMTTDISLTNAIRIETIHP